MDKDELRRLMDAEVEVAEKADRMPASCAVRTVPWSGGWELHIEGEGVTQVSDLSEADAQIRNYLSTLYGAPADHVQVQISPHS